jgi:hypothetical protein
MDMECLRSTETKEVIETEIGFRVETRIQNLARDLEEKSL